MLHRTQKASCLLNPFPTSGGKKSLFILELRIEGSQKWRLDALLEITSCVFSFPLEPWVDFSIQLCQWGNVPLSLEFLDSLPVVWLCLNAFWGNAGLPCLNTECSLRWILRTGGCLFMSLSPPSPTMTPRLDYCRWRKALLHLVFLEQFFRGELHGNYTRCALAQRFRNTPWHLPGTFILLVQDDSPAKQFIFFLAGIFACRHPQKLSGKLSGPKATQIFLILLCLPWASPH